ncbi:probable serine/threonine-protein kinase DDB_G0267686 [Episyrphus balteatus]|uniref:probable serine/threonine-protein kinase DDB_G0267686 n=1 Tax=Episyrphus balteatus TaxID=286459 RepID=UPI0024859E80|nr:probable serine/threonine-protein kinase DDB_G0267686 [Episyrphus balteatus]
MMDQQRETQNQQQQQQQQRSSHHRRPPDVEEALSSMLWTPYERTPTESSSDDDDERLNRKLRKSQSSHEQYYQYGGLTLAPPAAIMPYFGSNDPITPFVPLSNHHDSVRNNNNINNSSCSILSYSNASINNNGGGTIGADYFRKTDRCDNFRFSYPYYGPIPSLNKCLSVEPPSYDSLYTKSKDATRVLSNLVTVSATPASDGVLQASYVGGSAGEGDVIQSNESYGRMVHSFTDNFVIECNSSSSPSASSSTSSTNSVAQNLQHLHQQHNNTPQVHQQYNKEVASNIAATNNNNNSTIPIDDVKSTNDDDENEEIDHNKQNKANEEQKQTEVNQLAAAATPAIPLHHDQQQKYHNHSPSKITIININKRQHDEQQEKQPQKQQSKPDSTTMLQQQQEKQQRMTDNERITERSHLGESNEVSSLSTFVANGLGVIANSRSLTVTTTKPITTTAATTTTTTVLSSKSSLRGLKKIVGSGGKNPKSRHVQLANIDPSTQDNEIIVHDLCRTRRHRRHSLSSSSSSGSAEDIVALAMRLNIPATGTDAPISASPHNVATNVNRGVRNVSVTTSSVFLSNSINSKGNYNNNNNSVAILSSNSSPSLTIQVNDSCSNIRNISNNTNNTANHGDFVVNQSIANNGISVVNCTYAPNSVVGVGEGSSSVVNSKSSSSSVPKSSKFLTVNNNNLNNLTDIQCSTSSTTNGLQQQAQPQHPSPTRTFTSTECQTDDIPILIRDDVNGGSGGGPSHTIISNNIGGVVDGNSALVRSPMHPDALLSREQRRRERRERRQQRHVQQQQQQQMQHQRLSRHHSHSHPPSQQPPLLQHPAHHTMSAAAAAMLRPMLPDILHSHFPPPYSALPLSQGAPPPPQPPPQLPPHAASLITPVISTVPIAATATMVGDGRFSIPLPIIRRSPSERSGKGCCGQWFAGPPLRALIAVVALGGVACALGGAALGATGLAGPPSSHLTAALLMIGVGVVLVTVSGAAWRLTAPGGPPCLGLGSSVDLGRCGRRPCSRGGGAPHGLLYPEFQHRPPPPSYQASMQEYRLRLLLLDRDRQNGVVRGSSPPPTYRSHTGSLLRAPLTTTIRGGPGSEYSLPPSYRSRNATPAIISSERSIETAPSGRLLANEDIPESSLCTISSNLDSSLPAYNAIISDNLHQQLHQQQHQPQQNSSLSRNSQQNIAPDSDNHSFPKDNTGNSKMVPQKQITPSTLGDGHQSSSTSSKEYSSSGDRTSLSLLQNDSAHPREQTQLLHLSEKLNPRVLANSNGNNGVSGGASNRTIGFLNIHSAMSSKTPSDSSMTTGKTKDLVTIVTISAQDNTSNQQHNSMMQPTSPSSQGEMDILAHL